jgi:hypothetical protein
MASGQPGVDTDSAVSSGVLMKATAVLGAKPVFWGRYFHAPGQIDWKGRFDTVNYAATENELLNSNRIKLLPIARQTPAVGGSDADGRGDAQKNVSALFEALKPAYLYGAAPDVLVFLDVEGAPSLSPAYYAGWSDELQTQGALHSGNTVTLHAALYMSQGDAATASALTSAVAAGALCAGAWIARYDPDVCGPAPAWNDGIVTPRGGLPCPILAWQYCSSDSCAGYDGSQTNPAHEAMLLARLPVPPGP